jgi:hypothetical protein
MKKTGVHQLTLATMGCREEDWQFQVENPRLRTQLAILR